MNPNASLIALPMHGQQKLSDEGYRTRDGHIIEWMGKLLEGDGPVHVHSRPEPQWLRPLVRKPESESIASNTIPVDSYSWKIPNVRNRRRWWLQSSNSYRIEDVDSEAPAIVWNPLIGRSNLRGIFLDNRKTVFDLLDDWTIHYAFSDIRTEVASAYGFLFEHATHVTANSEGTLALAQKYGRNDAALVLNGCDPMRFSEVSSAEGPTKVGYVGKIGNRVDLELVLDTAMKLPEVDFVFAGPILDRQYRGPLSSIENITLLGDVHYRDVPRLLTTFDVGWVPHRVGEYEVGGDVIKTYEYRAAGLPVLTTPIIGAGERGLDAVEVLPASDHADWIRACIGSERRVPRKLGDIPIEHTWEYKVRQIRDMLYS